MVFVLGTIHDLPKSPKKLLEKFDPKKNDSLEDHINKSMLSLHSMNVQHEDVECWLFPYTFQVKDSTWYFNIPQGSITWDLLGYFDT